ncbi:hypothetical protein PhCBS80983_g01701 [Powellomyces hirtus]|uniref:Glycosyltransferase family 92 protein n=1 Tax=Powellomyces hirtus TaxID=109895 RepID=A0A507E950_9FUNG|nr:hypothetical protein PhCBS80983_g01701 [Powellomyces hirtus]
MWQPVSEGLTTWPQRISSGLGLSTESDAATEYAHPALGKPGHDMNSPYLVLATMIFQQADYLPEWIEFHLLQGIDRIVMYHDSRSNLPDRTREIAEPYIQEGIVEWIEWPADWEKIEEPPFGPRTWIEKEDRWTAWHFNDTMVNDCVNPNPDRTTHTQAGCQKAAFIDAAARYRKRARWVGAWDVDEFVFGFDNDRKEDFNWEDHKLSKKMTDMEEWDEIWVDGDIFGTNGYFTDPSGPAPDLKFPMITELYNYRFAQEDHVNFDNRKDIQAFGWSRKAIANPKYVISNHIHGWETEIPEFENREARRHSTGFSDIFMFHYQYRSLTGCHVKALGNGNPDMEYNPVRDAYFDEQEDNRIKFMIPMVKERIQQRQEVGWWKYWMSEPTIGPFADLVEDDRQSRICLAFSFLDQNLARLRKSVTSIIHHLRTYEPDVTFESVLLARSTANHRIFDEFPIDRIEYVDEKVPKSQAMNILFDMCEAPYIVSLVDGWETRTTWLNPARMAIVDMIEKAIKSPIIQNSIDLMEARADLLEVWVGDVPNIESYWSNRTEWQETPWRIAQTGKATDIGWYRVQSPSGKSAQGVARLGGSIKHRGRRATVTQQLKRRRNRRELPVDIADDDVAFADRAASLGFSSAHFCLGRNPDGVHDECDLDVDVLENQATSGVMWRMRPVLKDHEADKGMVDRM